MANTKDRTNHIFNTVTNKLNINFNCGFYRAHHSKANNVPCVLAS